MPELVGGSADLAESNLTTIEGGGDVRPGDFAGRNLHFGIREHGMGSILNGLILHRGLKGFGSTFLIFSDYMRPAVRLASLIGVPATYVWTHDSIWLGEDGPTHQPVEHLMALRAIPNLYMLRPCDANEVSQAWRVAVERRDGPCGFALSRQALPTLDRVASSGPPRACCAAAYVLADTDGVARRHRHGDRRGGARRPGGARDAAGRRPRRAASSRCPAGSSSTSRTRRTTTRCCRRRSRRACRSRRAPPSGGSSFIGPRGKSVGLDRYGASAPGKVVARELGISPEAVVAAVREVTGRDA